MEKYKNLESSNTLIPFGVQTTKTKNKGMVVVLGEITVTAKKN